MTEHHEDESANRLASDVAALVATVTTHGGTAASAKDAGLRRRVDIAVPYFRLGRAVLEIDPSGRSKVSTRFYRWGGIVLRLAIGLASLLAAVPLVILGLMVAKAVEGSAQVNSWAGLCVVALGLLFIELWILEYIRNLVGALAISRRVRDAIVRFSDSGEVLESEDSR